MIPVELTEWDKADRERYPVFGERALIDLTLANPVIEQLRDRIIVSNTSRGLEIVSTSFVGRVDLGRIRIIVKPKLPTMPLARLLRYAYGLRDLTTLQETFAPNTTYGLHDLLISMLITEVEELLHRGPARKYVSLENGLASPRGRILIGNLARQGGIREARLPCQYFERHLNWHLNQVVCAGLNSAVGMTGDRDVQRHLYRVAKEFENVDTRRVLRTEDIDRAEQGLTRLTEAYRSAIRIIRLLHNMQGLDFANEIAHHRVPGFLFDMNAFFQQLVSRFLHENLKGQRVIDEWAIRTVFAYAPFANPKKRTPPKPRPDYALFQGKSLFGFMDAKYRDIWEKGFPADWLYQLSIYALGSPARRSILLYASVGSVAEDEQIDIQSPVHWNTELSSSVILRPVPLDRIARLLDHYHAPELAAERSRMAAGLVRFEPRPSQDAPTREQPSAA